MVPETLRVIILLQVVAGRAFISSPPEYEASKVRVWRLSPEDASALEQQ
jgi:hypothetical protein